MLTFLVPLKTISTTNAREHWAKKANRVRAERDAVNGVTRGSPVPRAVRYAVKLVRVAPEHLQCDGHDNLTSSLKATCDATAAWLGIDDGDPRISWSYGQEVGRYAVRIEVEPVLGDPRQKEALHASR